VVTSALDGEVLEVLARADAAFTGREVARRIGASMEGTRQVLARLVAQGTVVRERAGAAQMYRLNRQHLAAAAVIALAGLREDLLTRLRQLLAGWAPAPAYAALFGSVARGQERPDSDLDVFVLRPAGLDGDDPAWDAQVAHLATQATAWTGNDTRVLQFGLDDLADVDEPGGVLDDILRDGIVLAGRESVLRRALRSIRSAS
jgi:hypothetical protein